MGRGRGAAVKLSAGPDVPVALLNTQQPWILHSIKPASSHPQEELPPTDALARISTIYFSSKTFMFFVVNMSPSSLPSLISQDSHLRPLHPQRSWVFKRKLQQRFLCPSSPGQGQSPGKVLKAASQSAKN